MANIMLGAFALVSTILVYLCAGFLLECVIGDGYRFQATIVLFWPIALVITVIKEIASWWRRRI